MLTVLSGIKWVPNCKYPQHVPNKRLLGPERNGIEVSGTFRSKMSTNDFNSTTE